MAFDYEGMLTKIDLTPLMQGLQLRQQRKQNDALEQHRQTQEQVVAREQTRLDDTAARKTGFVEAFGKVSETPTQAGWRMLRGRFPDFMDQIDGGEKAYSAAGNSVMMNTAGNVLAGIDAGKPEVGLAAIDETLPLIDGSGIPPASLNTIRGLLASGKPEQVKAARGIATMILAQHSGDRFDQVYSSLGRDQRETELQPYRMRGAVADAGYKETRAAYAPVQQQATLAGKQVRNANTAGIIAKRNAPKPAPAARPPRAASQGGRKPVTATLADGSKVKLVNGAWVKM